MEEGVEGATALALPSVVALEEVAAEAGAATAPSLCPGDMEVVDVVEGLAAEASITWVAAEGLPWEDATVAEAMEAEWAASVEAMEED